MNKRDYSPWGLFWESCKKYEESIMVIYEDKQLTYGQMYKKVQSFCGLIGKVEFGVGGIYLPNSTELISCMLALNKLGKVVVPLSYQLKGRSLLGRLGYSDIELIITDEKGLAEIKRLEGKTNLSTAIVLHGNGSFEIYALSNEDKKAIDIDKNIFAIFLISRAEKEYLGVMVSNYSIVSNTLANAEIMGLESGDRLLAVRSFSIADPVVGDLLTPISCGASIVILRDLFHPAIVLKAIQDYKITSALMVGTMLALVLGYPQLESFNLGCLRRIEFASITTPLRIVEDMIKKLPDVKLYCIYGLPEAPTRVSYLGPPDVIKFPGSVGRAIKGYGIKILKEGELEAGCGEEGIIYLTGSCLMDGYYKYEQSLSDILTGDCLKTNDKGYKDGNGLLYLTGRTDDMIMQGGYEIYPAELENMLLAHHSIEGVVVFGVHDEKLGQRTVALLRIKPGCNVETRDVVGWCRANIEEKKIPKEIYIIDRDIKNSLHKMNKNEIEAFYSDFV